MKIRFNPSIHIILPKQEKSYIMDQPNFVTLADSMEAAANALKELTTKFNMAQAELEKVPNLEPAGIAPQLNQLTESMTAINKAMVDTNQTLEVLNFAVGGQNQRIEEAFNEINRLCVYLPSLFLEFSSNLGIN